MWKEAVIVSVDEFLKFLPCLINLSEFPDLNVEISIPHQLLVDLS